MSTVTTPPHSRPFTRLASAAEVYSGSIVTLLSETAAAPPQLLRSRGHSGAMWCPGFRVRASSRSLDQPTCSTRSCTGRPENGRMVLPLCACQHAHCGRRTRVTWFVEKHGSCSAAASFRFTLRWRIHRRGQRSTSSSSKLEVPMTTAFHVVASVGGSQRARIAHFGGRAGIGWSRMDALGYPLHVAPPHTGGPRIA